jgi:hypothetical protein
MQADVNQTFGLTDSTSGLDNKFKPHPLRTCLKSYETGYRVLVLGSNRRTMSQTTFQTGSK